MQDYTLPYETKSSSVIKAAGVFQILSGALAMILTIVDANSEETFKIPNIVDKSNTTISVKNKWTKEHTILTVLSGGLVVSGIFTVSF